ncbi:hypothetical protein ACFQ9Q_38040 [Streptomyces virginiae]|uniref:hypothetical protein n=1 Tax=Streptomyces virginiae TaxID=1961 RepID=UPI0036AF954D
MLLVLVGVRHLGDVQQASETYVLLDSFEDTADRHRDLEWLPGRLSLIVNMCTVDIHVWIRDAMSGQSLPSKQG